MPTLPIYNISKYTEVVIYPSAASRESLETRKTYLVADAWLEQLALLTSLVLSVLVLDALAPATIA